VGSLKDLSLKIIKINPNISPEASFAIKNIENNTYLINFICSNTDIKVQDKQKLLEMNSLRTGDLCFSSFLSRRFRFWNLRMNCNQRLKATSISNNGIPSASTDEDHSE